MNEEEWKKWKKEYDRDHTIILLFIMLGIVVTVINPEIELGRLEHLIFAIGGLIVIGAIMRNLCKPLIQTLIQKLKSLR